MVCNNMRQILVVVDTVRIRDGIYEISRKCNTMPCTDHRREMATRGSLIDRYGAEHANTPLTRETFSTLKRRIGIGSQAFGNVPGDAGLVKR